MEKDETIINSDKAGESQVLALNTEEIEEMFKAGVHFAYSKSKRNPKMALFIYGIKNNTEIFDLEKTDAKIREALEFVKKLSEDNKQILFVGTKPGIGDIIKKAAEELNMPYVSNRWIGGTLTNFKIIRGRVNEYEKLKNDIENDNLQKYTKKERIKISKEFEKMGKNFSGLLRLVSLPQALVIIDPKEENTAVREAKRMSIPVVAVMNSDCDPAEIDYPIPANDSAIRSVDYLTQKILKTVKGE